jgi:hypothetical protein
LRIVYTPLIQAGELTKVVADSFCEREREREKIVYIYIPPKIQSITKEYDTHSSSNDN